MSRLLLPKPKRQAPQPKRIPRKARPRRERKTPRAFLARQCAALWSAAVLRKGGCWLGPSLFCSDHIDPAHVFPKGACPAVRYDPAYGLPTCRWHHRLLGNGLDWHDRVIRLWGPKLYAERFRKAHEAGTRPDLRAIRDALRAA